MPNSQPCKLAVTAAANAEAAGVAPILITVLQAVIAAILPQLNSLLSGCLPSPTPASTRDFLCARYNRRKQRYARGVLDRAENAIEEKTATMGNQFQMNPADLMTTAVATLDAVRLGSDQDIQEAMQLTVTDGSGQADEA